MKSLYLYQTAKVKLIWLAVPLWAFSLLLFAFSVNAQTYTTGLSSANTTGQYYSNTSIHVSTGFSAHGTIGTFHAYITGPDCVPLATSLSRNQNYVVTYTPRVAGITNPADSTHSACEVMTTVQYFDGIGRPIQTIQVKGSSSLKNLVAPKAYDQFGT